MLRLLTIVTTFSFLGCEREPAPEWRFGFNITGLEFELYDDTEGIHPSDVTLENPNNPFRDYPIGDETKFAIGNEGGNAGAFYAWATLLARIPTGEHQFYTAVKLADISSLGINEPGRGELENEEERMVVRLMAIAGFQSVLDNFPDSVIFDATGTQSFRLATPSYLAILELGGEPEGDWVLLETPDGGVQAVQGGNTIVPLPEGEKEEEEEEES